MNSRNIKFSVETVSFCLSPRLSKNLSISSVCRIQPFSSMILMPSRIYFSSCTGFVFLSFMNCRTSS